MKVMNCQDKTAVPAGPDRFGFYFRQAQVDKCINFDGASGPLDFDNETGEALSDIATWCVRRNSNGSYGFDPPLGGYYSAENQAVIESDPPLDLSSNEWCAPAVDK
jgi:hypothetical protein